MSIVLAFSGGLDTSFCIPYLQETYHEPIITVTVNTGGVSAEEAAAIARKSAELGAEQHFTVDGRDDLFQNHLSYLIKGNVLRGGVYPLCVGPERVTQAKLAVDAARRVGARAIAHGSTGAGNDQVRFDVALRLLAADLGIITPIRELGLSREETTAYLKERGIEVPEKKTTYSINQGLWGTTIGGRETLDTRLPLPEDAYPYTTPPRQAPDASQRLRIGFREGVPVSLDGQALGPVALIEELNRIGGRHGVGRAIHVGDTILGIKGRVAFEAPAALILIAAHRELEKIVLSRWQQYQKGGIAELYGMLLHEGQYFDPAMRDMEAYLDSSQGVVTGEASVQLYKGHIDVLGCESPYSLFNTGVATYGEKNTLWDGRDARGFTQIYGLQGLLAARARENASAV